MVYSQIIQKFKLDYVGSEDVEPILYTMLIPDRPVKIKFTPRMS